MYSRFKIAQKYLHYLVTAGNGKGHGVHPPFIYNFIKEVLNNRQFDPQWAVIELLRNKLKKDDTVIEVEDFGAGSTTNANQHRSVAGIANTALKSAKYAQLIARIANYYSCNSIIELGTSLGITTSYLAVATPFCNVVTCEGSKNIAAIAKQNFEQLFLKNIQLLQGEFSITYPKALAVFDKIDLLYIDGNHQEEPTVEYFVKALPQLHENSIVILDDIHWSQGMENAWLRIQEHELVSETIDLFFIGIVFLRKAQKAKQHFTIRF